VKFRRQLKSELSINLTPLIDVVFLLLIFFMVSTTFTREAQLTVTLPEASAKTTSELPERMEIVISATGKYSLNGRVLANSSMDTLLAALQEESAGDRDLPLAITADADAAHQYVVRAMDAAGQLGFARLSITTREAE
jgi:biopolymer transport protein ExbD